MIVEAQSYRIKPGRRDEFIQFFETRAMPALRSHAMKILGPLLDATSWEVIGLKIDWPDDSFAVATNAGQS
jgi:hypothetical protein